MPDGQKDFATGLVQTCGWTPLFAVGNPDIFHLRGVLQKPASFRDSRIEPVDRAAFVGPDLLQISDGHGFRRSSDGLVSVAPDGIDVIVLRQHLEQLRRRSPSRY